MKKTLKGASLVEALVASVLFLTVFLIAMSSLMTIARITVSGPSPVEMEESVKEGLDRFKKGTGNSGSWNFRWGVVEVEAEPYRTADDVTAVTVTAKADNGRTIVYRYLI